MDDLQKTIIRIHHWVGHGADHLRDYQQAAEILDAAGQTEAAAEMRRVVELETQAAAHTKRAAEIVGPPPKVGQKAGHDHGHDHNHHHGHGHDHDH